MEPYFIFSYRCKIPFPVYIKAELMPQKYYGTEIDKATTYRSDR